MKFCTNCGAKLTEGAKFCTNCGTKIMDGNNENKITIYNVSLDEHFLPVSFRTGLKLGFSILYYRHIIFFLSGPLNGGATLSSV